MPSGDVQSGRPYSIGVSSIFRATSEKTPRDFQERPIWHGPMRKGPIQSIKACHPPLRHGPIHESQSRIGPRRGPGAPRIEPKLIPEPSRDGLHLRRASPRRLGIVSRASRGIPGAPRERPEGPQVRPSMPERSPGTTRKRAESTKIHAESHLRIKKSSFFRAVHLRSDIVAIVR